MGAYLDYNATAPLRPEAKAAMVAALDLNGNPSSLHRDGAEARYQLEKARRGIARLLGLGAGDRLIFTSGGSEANNLAVRGVVDMAGGGSTRPHVVTSSAEHRAVLDPVRHLASRGACRLSIVDPDANGRVAVPSVEAVVSDSTVLVSLMLANNEVGSINAIPALAEAVRRVNATTLVHTDAVQALGRIPVNFRALGVDLMTVAAHKVGGPKGIGALVIREGVELEALISGGLQEDGIRAGTENVPAVVGFAAALKSAIAQQASEAERLIDLREQLWQALSASMPELRRNSPDDHSLPNTLNVAMPGVQGTAMVRVLDEAGFAVSAGSACSSLGPPQPSHVLLAMGLGDEVASSSIRISLGYSTTKEECDAFADALPQAIDRLHQNSDVPGLGSHLLK